LNTAGKEETLKETIDALSTENNAAGGKVETVQKMDKRNFSRVADKRNSSGFYVNIIFESKPSAITQLQSRFSLNQDVFRVMFTNAPVVEKAEAK
jgi:ribosomal protein S6